MFEVWVIKCGSSIIRPQTSHADKANQTHVMSRVSADIAKLLRANIYPVIVSSGAVAFGMAQLNIEQRPTDLKDLQALAAIGQAELIGAWSANLAQYQVPCAQVLVNRADCDHPAHKHNLSNTFAALQSNGAVAICNENDSVATEELRYGDNDNLAASIAILTNATRLILLTDTAGLYTAPPESDDHDKEDKEDKEDKKDRKLVATAAANEASLDTMVGSSGKFGRGGMFSKLQAARRAAHYGIDTYIGDGPNLDSMLIAQWQGTLLTAQKDSKLTFS